MVATASRPFEGAPADDPKRASDVRRSRGSAYIFALSRRAHPCKVRGRLGGSRSPMYADYYRLKSDPFALTPDDTLLL